MHWLLDGVFIPRGGGQTWRHQNFEFVQLNAKTQSKNSQLYHTNVATNMWIPKLLGFEIDPKVCKKIFES